jgi:hypothetical protein
MTKLYDLIVEEIVIHLRPFKRDEKFAVDQTKRRIAILEQLSKADGKKLRPSEAKKKRSKYRSALAAIIAASERLPPGALDTYMFFAQTPERRQRYAADRASKRATGRPLTDPFLESREGGAELLRLLKVLAMVVAGRESKSQDGIMPDILLKTAVAGHARELMLKASRQQITGTADKSYQVISSLLFKAIRGKEIDFKRWCDADIKRQREHKKILQSFQLAGTEFSNS